MRCGRVFQRSRLPLKNPPISLRFFSSCYQFHPNPSLTLINLKRHLPIYTNSNPYMNSNQSEIYNCNLILSTLGRCGDVVRARELFHKMPQRDVITYASMINIYLKNGDLPRAERLFSEMPERNVVVESAMIDGYAKAGRLADARMVFDGMKVRNVYSWTSLVSAYCRGGRMDQAWRLFEEMPEKNVVSWTTMVLGFARNGSISGARDVFDRMPEKNVVSWTAMIKGYVDHGRVDEARELFDKMPNRNIYSWNVMISGCLNSNKTSEAIELFRSMPQRNIVSWTTMVTGLAQNGLIESAREFFEEMPVKDIAAWNAMITAYLDEGMVCKARELFDSMPERNVVTWNAMIDGYVKKENSEEALRLFLLLLHSLVKCNETTLTSILVACECIVEVMQIHGLALKLGFELDTSLTNALVTMYSKCGDISSSQYAFEGLVVKDVVSWTSMILAYSNHGCGHYALQVFAHMLKHGEKPDGITFVGVLSACSHVGLVKKGKMIFGAMSHVFCVEPMAEHYSCLVDLLGRSGHVEEAKSVVRDMPPGKRDEAILGALLGACRVHNEIEIAINVGEELIQLEPSDSGAYVLLANAYASQGQWNNVARVRKMMKEKKVKKVPGYSQIEVEMKRHLFCVSDRSHPQSKRIYEMLEEVLLPQMKETGFFEELLGFPLAY